MKKCLPGVGSYLKSLLLTAFKSEFNDCRIPYNIAENHRIHYSRNLGDNVLIFVHPFFAEQSKELMNINYYSNYKKVIINALRLEGWSKAWFTYPGIYREGKDLLEDGIFSKAFFTQNDRGIPENENELAEFKNKNIVILGSYAEWCVDELVKSFMNQGINNLSVLSEGVLFAEKYLNYNNKSNDELFKTYQNSGEIACFNVIHLSDLLKSSI